MYELVEDCQKIISIYPDIIGKYHNTGDRECAFLIDLVDCIMDITALLTVHEDSGRIYPGYALEKVERMERKVKSAKEYFQIKMEEIENEKN